MWTGGSKAAAAPAVRSGAGGASGEFARPRAGRCQVPIVGERSHDVTQQTGSVPEREPELQASDGRRISCSLGLASAALFLPQWWQYCRICAVFVAWLGLSPPTAPHTACPFRPIPLLGCWKIICLPLLLSGKSSPWLCPVWSACVFLYCTHVLLFLLEWSTTVVDASDSLVMVPAKAGLIGDAIRPFSFSMLQQASPSARAGIFLLFCHVVSFMLARLLMLIRQPPCSVGVACCFEQLLACDRPRQTSELLDAELQNSALLCVVVIWDQTVSYLW